MNVFDLVDGIELLCLDAGNTIVFFDTLAASEAALAGGFVISPQALEQAFGAMKRALESDAAKRHQALVDPEIPPTWSTGMGVLVEHAAGLNGQQNAECVRALWLAHREFNLWRAVPDELPAAVQRVRNAGVPVCVVSNSEGQLAALFQRLGLGAAFDLVIDSHVLGVEKPDPAIFRHALSHFGVAPEHTLHIGDVYATDIVGARAAGVRAAIIDPQDHYAGLHPDVPRVASVAHVAAALVGTRKIDA